MLSCWEVSRTGGMLHMDEGEVAGDDGVFFGDDDYKKSSFSSLWTCNLRKRPCINRRASSSSQGCEESKLGSPHTSVGSVRRRQSTWSMQGKGAFPARFLTL